MLLSVLRLQKPGLDLADTYIAFVRQNQDILREHIADELHLEALFLVSYLGAPASWWLPR